MKILQLCLSDGKGGLELYAARVIGWLNEKGWAFCAAVAPGTFLSDRLDKAGIRSFKIGARSHLFPILSALHIARLIEKEKVGIIHIHWGKDLALAAMAKWLCRRPVRLIYTRQMEITGSKKDLYHRLIYSQVDRFVAITGELKKKAEQFLPLPKENIKLLYYGVPEGRVASGTSCGTFFRKAGVHEKSFKIGLFGRIEHFKGHHLMVDAVERLVQAGNDVEAVFIGHVMDDSYFKTLMKEIDERGLKNRIHYFGFHPDPMAVMSCFDVVALTTYSETFGLVLIEAMRSGTAVIGSNAGGVPEIIDDGQTGLLFEPGDPHDLADAIERLVKDSGFCERLAHAGKEKSDRLFSEEEHFVRLERLLCE